MPKTGRPRFKWSARLEALICARLSSGKSLTEICRKKRFPSYAAVMERISLMEAKEIPSTGFVENYARSRTRQTERFVEELIAIADDGTNDFYADKEGKPLADQENINRSRLRVDTRKWIASKLLPKKYGEQRQGDINVTAISGTQVVLNQEEQRSFQERVKLALEDSASPETPSTRE